MKLTLAEPTRPKKKSRLIKNSVLHVVILFLFFQPVLFSTLYNCEGQASAYLIANSLLNSLFFCKSHYSNTIDRFFRVGEAFTMCVEFLLHRTVV